MLRMSLKMAIAGRSGCDGNRGAIAGIRSRHDVARFVAHVHAGLRQYRRARGSMLEPFGLVELRDEVGEREFEIVGALMLGDAKPVIVARRRLMVTLAGERLVAQVVERVTRGDIERSVNIDESAVEVEK